MTASPNLDLVRSIYAAWERGEFRSTEWAHPEIEYSIAGGPAPGSWKGVATCRRRDSDDDDNRQRDDPTSSSSGAIDWDVRLTGLAL